MGTLATSKMKTLQTISILIFLTLSANSQEIERINTKDLISVSNEFGLDSALHLSGGFPIYRVDSATAISLLDKMTEYKRYTRSEYFFNGMAHNWNNDFVKNKTEFFANSQLERISKTKSNEFDSLIVLDDKLAISIVKQNLISLDSVLLKSYKSNLLLSDTLKDMFPSGFVRFFKSFRHGTLPIVRAYEDCNKNCYKIMQILGELKSDKFDSKKMHYHHNQLRPYQQNRDFFRFQEYYGEYDTTTIKLSSDYNTISELDFQNETELNQIIKGFDEDKCWKFIIQNDEKGFLDLGCQFAPLSGYGIKYKLVLIDKNRLQIIKIAEWIS